MTGVRFLERVGSTQDVVHDLAAAGVEGGVAVVAREQTDGRGSRRRRWHSPPGGLWLSFLWRPRTAAAVETLSLRVGLAVAGALETVPEMPAVSIKWPNDLVVADRKAGGILCEARWQGGAPGWVAVGVGINVTNALPAGLRHVAIALATCCPDLTPERLIEPVVGALRRLDDSAPFLSDADCAAFCGRDWLAGRTLTGPVCGIGAGVAPHGALRVRQPDGQIALVRSGPVELPPFTESRACS